MLQTSRHLAAAAGTALVAALAAFPAAAGAAAPPSTSGGPKPFLDVRAAAKDRAGASAAAPARTLPAASRSARSRLMRGLGEQAVLEPDAITATPRMLGRLDGALTGAQAGDAADLAMRYVRANATALGVDAGDLATLRLSDRFTVSGVTHLRWRQSYRGIPAYDNDLRVNVDGDGRVINVLGAPRHDLAVPSVAPRLSAAAAMGALVRNVGGTRAPKVSATPGGARGDTRFGPMERAQLVLFGDVNAVRLAWHVTYDAAPNAFYAAVVDATSGRVLVRKNLVNSIDGLVFDQYPGAPRGGDQRTQVLDPFLSDPSRLFGEFAHAWSDINDANPAGATDETADPTEEVAPAQYPFTDFTSVVGAAGACDSAHRCSWDHRARLSWEANRRQNAVQAFYYVNHFHDHLAGDPIGFTAASGAFEGADRVNVETDDGAATANGLPDEDHQDNANMLTPPDGQSPRMQMYLFLHDETLTPAGRLASPFRDVNGGDDAAIVYHEYTHGLSNRLVLDAEGAGALGSHQSGSMGEAWSDWYAKDLLAAEGFQLDDPAVPGEVDMGAYTDSPRNSIRTQPLDCPVGSGPPACPGPVPPSLGTAGPGGYTYGDMGKINRNGVPEVHSDGEIWGETLWDLRQAVGSAVSEEIVTEGMRLSPPEPSFLDMRNAILQADIALRDGAEVDAIWDVFAGRGMGFFAGTEDAADTAPVENFQTPPAADAPTGTITGRVTDSITRAPLAGIVVGIGGLDTPPSSFVTTTAADGSYTIGPVPAGTYPIVVFHPSAGYERVTARTVAVPADGSVARDAAMRRDWAALSGGAAVATTNDDIFGDFGCGVDGAFDLSLGAGWSAYNATTPGFPGFPPNTHQGAPPTATVRLPNPVNVTGFGVDPSNTCGDDVSAATKDLRIEVSTDGATFTPAMTHTFAPADLGRLNMLSTATLPGIKAVRVTMLSSQSAAGTGQHFTDLSEFEVFGAAGQAVTPAAPAGPAAPAPAPGTTPQPGGATLPGQAASQPTARISASRVRGRAMFQLGCSSACRATATMTVSRATARRARLASTRIARVTRRLNAAGRRTFGLTVSRSTLGRMRARGLRTVSATVAVVIRDARGQTRTVRRAVRVRVR
jgi:extracellular elastinolytic metalloproteinase